MIQVLDRERSPYFTQNLHYLDANYNKWLSRYRAARYAPWRYRLRHVDSGPTFESRAASPARTIQSESEVSIRPTWEAPRVSSAPEVSRASAARIYSPTPVLATSERYDPEAEALKILADAGYKNLTKADLARLHPSDHFEEELQVMADVRAYFQVAFKVRLIRAHRWSTSLLTYILDSVSSTTSP